MFIIKRDEDNPVLSPERDHPWEAIATYNPSVVHTPGGYRMYYRALGNPDALVSPHQGISSVGTAFSEDGKHFHTRKQVIAPQEDWDRFGCEDPRATHFEGKWYVFYTALGGYPFGPDNIKVGVAIGETADRLTERHLVTNFNAKAATLLSERIDGQVVLLLTAHTDWSQEHQRPTIAIAKANNVEDFFNPEYWNNWHEHLPDHAVEELRRADDDHVEVGATPFKTDLGWLMLYSYIHHYYDESRRTFCVGAALLDAQNPQKVLSRTHSFLVSEQSYEEYGLVPHIVFPTSVSKSGHAYLDLWYGAADTVCAKATLRLNDLLAVLDPRHTRPTLVRAPENPILTPRGEGFEHRDVFNAAAIDLGGSVHILYRAMDAFNTSTIGYARSEDGIRIDERRLDPIYRPREEFELKRGKPDGNSGCEDPRIVQIANQLYMTYTAYDGVHSPRGAVTSIGVDEFLAKQFNHWSKPFLLTPDDLDDKDLCLLPAQVDGGKYLLYHRVASRICADILPDLSSGQRISRCIEIIGPRRGMWDGAKVGIAAPPFKVKDGWLMIYHAVSEWGTYRLGALLLDHAGTSVLARSADPILEPEMDYEKEGEVRNVVFSCGAVVRGDTLFVYYGAGDKVLSVATGSFSELEDSLSWQSHHS